MPRGTVEQRRLATSVRAEQREPFAACDGEIDAGDDVALAVSRRDVLEGEDGRGHRNPLLFSTAAATRVTTPPVTASDTTARQLMTRANRLL